MKCVILQPSYIPWRGYFHQIYKADTFIFFDDVQYDRRGWRNRNRVKTISGTQWLSIPVLKKGFGIESLLINQVKIDNTRNWRKKHFRTLKQIYGKAPFFTRYEGLLESLYQRSDVYLADFTIDLTIAISRELGIKNTVFRRSSEFQTTGKKTDRLISLLKAVGATHYITGANAKDYIEEEKFAAAQIKLEYMIYDYPLYEQLYNTYDAQVSILDLLFIKGAEEAGRYIWGSENVKEFKKFV